MTISIRGIAQTWLLLLALGIPAFANNNSSVEIMLFDAPGAGILPGQGTIPFDINVEGEIVGYYIDANNIFHGFSRTPNGAFESFEAADGGEGTSAQAVNVEGAITGYSVTDNGISHGFVRAPDGALTTVDVPDAVLGTQPGDINLFREVVGSYIDAEFSFHGFFRTRDGEITTFDVPNAGTGFLQGTFPCIGTGLNDFGVVVGSYVDADSVNHGFLRSRDGVISTFDAPSSAGTFPGSINLKGEVTGIYVGALDGVDHGFVRTPDGRFTSFDAPGAGTGQFQGTQPSTINALGTVVGYTVDADLAWRAFIRAPDGKLTTFESAEGGTGPAQGTNAFAINLTGEIIGIVTDGNSVSHGFVARLRH